MLILKLSKCGVFVIQYNSFEVDETVEEAEEVAAAGEVEAGANVDADAIADTSADGTTLATDATAAGTLVDTAATGDLLPLESVPAAEEGTAITEVVEPTEAE